MARLRRSCAGARRGPGDPAAGAGEVPGDLRDEPGRVLPGPRRRSARARRRRGQPAQRGRAHRPGAARRHPGTGEGADRAGGRGVPRPGLGRPRVRGDPVRDLGRPRRRGPTLVERRVRAADLPGAHPAGGRPRAPLPLHLDAVAQPRCDRGRPHHRGTPVRPGEGAVAAAAVRRHARRAPVRAARARHRGPPRPALPRDGGHRQRCLPGDAQRGPDRRGRGGRRPARRDRDGAAPSPVRQGRAPRGGRRHLLGPARGDPRGARARGVRRVRPRGADRPRRAVLRLRRRCARAEVPGLRAGHPAATQPRGGRRGPGDLRRDVGRRHPRAPPLRQLRDLGRGVHPPGGDGRGCPDDQADAVPHLRGQPDRRVARSAPPSRASRSSPSSS